MGWWASAGGATTPAHSSSSSDAPRESDPSVLSRHTETGSNQLILNSEMLYSMTNKLQMFLIPKYLQKQNASILKAKVIFNTTLGCSV